MAYHFGIEMLSHLDGDRAMTDSVFNALGQMVSLVDMLTSSRGR